MGAKRLGASRRLRPTTFSKNKTAAGGGARRNGRSTAAESYTRRKISSGAPHT